MKLNFRWISLSVACFFSMTIVQKFKCQFQWWDSINIFMIIKCVTINVQCGRWSTYNAFHFVSIRSVFVHICNNKISIINIRVAHPHWLESLRIESMLAILFNRCNLCFITRACERISVREIEFVMKKIIHCLIPQSTIAFFSLLKQPRSNLIISQFMNKSQTHTNKQMWMKKKDWKTIHLTVNIRLCLCISEQFYHRWTRMHTN